MLSYLFLAYIIIITLYYYHTVIIIYSNISLYNFNSIVTYLIFQHSELLNSKYE